MPGPLSLLALSVLLSLSTFVLLVIAGRRMGTTLCGILGTLSSLGAFSLALVTLMNWLNGGLLAGTPWGAGRGPLSVTFPWASGLRVGLYVDSLTVLISIAGSLISAVVHLFTTGYLRHDVRGPRVFSLMALATGALTGLACSPCLLQWAVWTTVLSVAAYLIAIPVPLGPGGLGITPVPRGLTAADIAQRASSSLASLIMRSSGDGALFVACIILAWSAPSLLWEQLWSTDRVPALAGWLIVLAAVCQSSALPVSLFLPEAKGSPTPAAGLAYSATLLPAGVLLLVRCFPLLQATHLAALSIIGSATLLSSALFALAEADLRRWISWVTAAGFGAMFAALGAGSPGGALLHLLAHMLGMGVLSLATGSVLHACLGERRMSHYGGLFFRMPASALLLAHGAATLTGAPLLAGSASWNIIIAHAFKSLTAGEPRGYISLAAILLGLLLLAASLARGWALIMTAHPRDREVYAAARESATLSVPVAILALIATVSGSALVSPVQQLISVLPREMQTAAVQSDFAPEHKSTAWKGNDYWRPIPPPILPAPLPPELRDDEDLPPVIVTTLESEAPEWTAKLRWSITALGAIGGLAIPWFLWRGPQPRQRARELLARAFHLPRISLRAAAILTRFAATLTLGLERLVLEPAIDLAGRIAIPAFRSPPALTRTRATLTLLLTAVLIAAAAVWSLHKRGDL